MVVALMQLKSSGFVVGYLVGLGVGLGVGFGVGCGSSGVYVEVPVGVGRRSVAMVSIGRPYGVSKVGCTWWCRTSGRSGG